MSGDFPRHPLETGFDPRLAGGAPSDPAYYVELGNSYLEMGSAADAVDAYRDAVALAPDVPECHYSLANGLADLGENVAAAAAYRVAIELRPDFFEALFNLSEVLTSLGLFDEAIEQYRTAISLSPEFVSAYNNLATVLMELGRADEAVEALQTAAALAPDAASVHANLGTALKDAGRYAEALASHRRAVEIEPDAAEAHFNLANALMQHGQLPEAESAYRWAIALSPEYARIYPMLGMALMAMDRHEEALTLCDEILGRVPGEGNALAFKVMVLQELGRRKEALYLGDYDALITESIIDCPPNYGDLAEFNAALVDHVLSHPTLVRSPLSNATVNGLHTGNLLIAPKGPFAEFETALWRAAEKYRENLPHDANHPFLVNPPKLTDLVVWSVVMEAAGHQVPHIHPTGWLSGVYYPELPNVIDDSGDACEGWLEFGMPPAKFGARQEQEARQFKPREGHLFIFPSYFYHRTIPYHTPERRISIAFDFLPQG